MREVFAIGILIAGLWGTDSVHAATAPSVAAPASCGALAKDLKAFQKAQSVLMRTFVQKNETLAETLELYSDKFQEQRGALRRADYASLKNSAEAFRSHGLRETRLIQKFEDSSSSLLSQVIGCLEHKTAAANSGSALASQ